MIGWKGHLQPLRGVNTDARYTRDDFFGQIVAQGQLVSDEHQISRELIVEAADEDLTNTYYH